MTHTRSTTLLSLLMLGLVACAPDPAIPEAQVFDSQIRQPNTNDATVINNSRPDASLDASLSVGDALTTVVDATDQSDATTDAGGDNACVYKDGRNWQVCPTSQGDDCGWQYCGKEDTWKECLANPNTREECQPLDGKPSGCAFDGAYFAIDEIFGGLCVDGVWNEFHCGQDGEARLRATDMDC